MTSEESLESYDGVLTLMAGTIRMADVAWVARGPATGQFNTFCDRFIEELFVQGDLEKDLNVVVSPFCDRDLTNGPRVQFGYVVVVAQPLITAYCGFVNNPGLTTALETG